MEPSLFEDLMASLEEAAAFSAGDTSRCRVITWKSPVPEYTLSDISRIRTSLGLSQWALSDVLGVSAQTVMDWEAGRGEIPRPVTHLLYLLERDPTLAEKLMPRRSSEGEQAGRDNPPEGGDRHEEAED